MRRPHLFTAVLCLIILNVSCVSTDAPSKDEVVIPADREFSILGEDYVAIGDQGSGNSNQYSVAKGMEAFCKSNNCDFGALLGDNFYDFGITSVRDKKWKTHFEDIYKSLVDSKGMPLKFYAALGNHDYAGNAKAQVQYSSQRWAMPHRYYTLHTPKADIIILDENKFDSAQRGWLEGQLMSSKAEWIILHGHFPVYSSGGHGDTTILKALLLPLLAKYHVDFYLAGHDHDMQLIAGKSSSPNTKFIISGGGGKLIEKPSSDKYSLFAAKMYGFVHLDFKESSVVLSYCNTSGTVVFQREYIK